MKTYPQNKFLEMTLERRVQIILDLVYFIEKHWDQPEEKASAFRVLNDYFSWMDFFNVPSPVLRRISSYHTQLDENLSLRQLLDLAVPLERFLELSLKDDAIIEVRQGDSLDKPKETLPLYFVLDHLRSSFNVGALFRTAECFGVRHIYLVGYTPTPEEVGVGKTAMGTERLVAWSTHLHLDEVIDELKNLQVHLVALETVESAQSIMEWEVPSSVALLVGNERFGLNQKSLQGADEILQIPLMGQKNSLNVANALSVVAYEVMRQWTK